MAISGWLLHLARLVCQGYEGDWANRRGDTPAPSLLHPCPLPPMVASPIPRPLAGHSAPSQSHLGYYNPPPSPLHSAHPHYASIPQAGPPALHWLHYGLSRHSAARLDRPKSHRPPRPPPPPRPLPPRAPLVPPETPVPLMPRASLGPRLPPVPMRSRRV